uniref:Uncharacterized protein LOC116945245 n=1 Tax=Petromyzon marinus TaxID=7757 RepID=A0AAJ7TEI2_PETMA|nr:uncharacterized protein LOC116945245 [Petromyzon marinus]
MSYGAVGECNSQFRAQRQAMSDANQTKYSNLSHNTSNCLKEMSAKVAEFDRHLGNRSLDLNERPLRINIIGIQRQIKALVLNALSFLCALTDLGSQYSEDQLMRLNRMRDEFLEMVQGYEQTQQKLYQKLDKIFGALVDFADQEVGDETDAHCVRPHVTREEQELRKRKNMANEAIQQQTEVMIDANEIQTRLNEAFKEMNRAIDSAQSRSQWREINQPRPLPRNYDYENANEGNANDAPLLGSRSPPLWTTRCCCVTIVITCLLVICLIVGLLVWCSLARTPSALQPITGPNQGTEGTGFLPIIRQ